MQWVQMDRARSLKEQYFANFLAKIFRLSAFRSADQYVRAALYPLQQQLQTAEEKLLLLLQRQWQLLLPLPPVLLLLPMMMMTMLSAAPHQPICRHCHLTDNITVDYV